MLNHQRQKVVTGWRLYSTLWQQLLLLLGLLLLLSPYRAIGAQVADQFISNGGYIVQNDSGLLQYREKDLFVPASTLKILTSLVAFKELGKEFRFETHFYLDEQQNLYIKGFGDPFLTSESVLEISEQLAALGINRLNLLFLDDSSFALNGETASNYNSANPYDAPNGALAVNFNALPIQIKRNGTIVSGESQTPVIALMKEAAATLSPGRHRINVATLLQPGNASPALRYTAELFTAQFQQAGISVQQGYSKKQVPAKLQPIYIHYSSKSLEEIVRACLQYSNNYIANQLFLASGAQVFGLPATWEKSRRTFAIFIDKSLQLETDQISVLEGSGLSRQNRISPSALLAILDHFKPYSTLLNQKHDILLKSGTMRDVYCYAGYFPQGNNLTPFAILLNQVSNNRDRILKALHAAAPPL